MDKLYYEEYFNLERNHWWFRARKKIIGSLLDRHFKKSGASVLNIGAATGETSSLLGKYGQVTSVEYEKDCCAFVKQKLNLDFIPASITELPFADNSFDLVSAFDVIEHVQDDKLAVKEMLRVCRPGGMIAITVPAYMFLWSRHDDINHHVRRYAQHELQALFTSLNGKKIYSSFFNTFLFPVVALTRLAANAFPSIVRRSGSGSDFSYSGGKVSTFLFYGVMSSENFWMRNGLSFPFGVSQIFLYQKAD